MYPSQPQVYVVAVLMPIVGTAAVAARFRIRIRTRLGLYADDWTILSALLLVWLMGAILVTGAAIESLGTHTLQDPTTGEEVLTAKDFNESKVDYAYNSTMILAFGLIKMSILLLYRRIFVGKVFNYLSLVLCVFVSLWSLAFFIAEIFQCGTHPAAAWTGLDVLLEYCDQVQDTQLSFAVTDVAGDLIILALPVFWVGRLHMPPHQKILIIGIFLLGLLSTASAVVRLVMIYLDEYETTTGYRDLIGVSTNIFLWSHVEGGVAVLAACLPTLRPIVPDAWLDSAFRSLRSVFGFSKASGSFLRMDQPLRAEDNGIELAKGSGSSSTSRDIA